MAEKKKIFSESDFDKDKQIFTPEDFEKVKDAPKVPGSKIPTIPSGGDGNGNTSKSNTSDQNFACFLQKDDFILYIIL